MRKLIPIIGAAVVALIVGVGGGWYVTSSMAPVAAAEPAGEHAEGLDAPPPEVKPHYKEYTIKDRVVNLADPGGRRYLKVTTVLQVVEAKAAAGQRKAAGAQNGGEGYVLVVWEPEAAGTALASGGSTKKDGATEVPNSAEVHDVLTTVLSSKRADEVMTHEGRERLREELRTAINVVMPADLLVAKVLFTDFIVQ